MDEQLKNAFVWRIENRYSYEQIEAEFVAAGYTPEQVRAYYREIQGDAAEGAEVPEPQATPGPVPFEEKPAQKVVPKKGGDATRIVLVSLITVTLLGLVGVGVYVFLIGGIGVRAPLTGITPAEEGERVLIPQNDYPDDPFAGSETGEGVGDAEVSINFTGGGENEDGPYTITYGSPLPHNATLIKVDTLPPDTYEATVVLYDESEEPLLTSAVHFSLAEPVSETNSTIELSVPPFFFARPIPEEQYCTEADQVLAYAKETYAEQYDGLTEEEQQIVCQGFLREAVRPLPGLFVVGVSLKDSAGVERLSKVSEPVELLDTPEAVTEQ